MSVSINRKIFGLCIMLALLLCATQIMGNTLFVLVCLAAYLLLLGWACIKDFTLPVLLFFLPWAQLLKMNPTSFSFYTFGLVLICGINLLKKTRFRKYHIIIASALLAVTLFSKMLDASGLSFDYIAFLMLVLLFPVVKDEWNAHQYDFYRLVFFFSASVILAALCAQEFATYSNIARYIRVDAYLTVTRLSGFYSDPNFYTAQITAALGGALVAILKETSKRRTTCLAVFLLMLLYCGLLSGSKSFIVIVTLLLVLWIIEVIKMRGRLMLKIGLLIGSLVAIVLIATATFLSSLVDVFVTRLSASDNWSEFTTGRVDIWATYLEELLSNEKLLLLGKGFSNINLNNRASHNTIIQCVYQFGLIGVPLMIAWSVYFYRDLPKMGKNRKAQRINTLLLLVGALMPWLALDMLFFDEFFLLQWYVFVALQQLRSEDSIYSLPRRNEMKTSEMVARRKKRGTT